MSKLVIATNPQVRPRPQPESSLLEGCVLWYRFDEMAGSIARDLSPMRNHGLLVNGPLWEPVTPSRITPSLKFTAASSQYISCAGVQGLPVGDEPYALVAVFKAPWQDGSDYGFVGWGNYGTALQVNAFRIGGKGLLNYWWANDLYVGADDWGTDFNVALAQYDGTDREIWLNGVKLGGGPPGQAHAVPNSANFRVGSTNNGEYMNGSLSSVLVFKRTFSGVDVQRLSDLVRS